MAHACHGRRSSLGASTATVIRRSSTSSRRRTSSCIRRQLLQDAKAANGDMTAASPWVASHGETKRRGVSSGWVHKGLAGKAKCVEGLICSVYLPTHGRALAEFEDPLEALESVLIAAPQLGWTCAVGDFNTVGGMWLTDGSPVRKRRRSGHGLRTATCRRPLQRRGTTCRPRRDMG